MDLQDEACLPPQARCYTTFPKHCGRVQGLGTPICHKTVVGGKQGHVPC